MDQLLLALRCGGTLGGVKQSGYGTGIGRHAIEEYTQPKAVWIDTTAGAAARGLTAF